MWKLRFERRVVQERSQSVTSIDLSPIVVEQMKKKYAGKIGLNFETMDVRKMDFPNDKFDLLLDKGTLDTLLCGDDADVNAAKAMAEYARVLRVGSACVIISHSPPDNRLPYFKTSTDSFQILPSITLAKPRLDESLEVKEREGGGDDVHYAYVLIRNKPSKPNAKQS